MPWRRSKQGEGADVDYAQVEAAAARMREALVPLNEQLHGLASHIATMRAALSAPRHGPLPPDEHAALAAVIAAAEHSYQTSLRTRDAVLLQAEELRGQSRAVRSRLGALAAREACSEAALQAEERVRHELTALVEATSRLQARAELSDL
jgi:hypothetical protein